MNEREYRRHLNNPQAKTEAAAEDAGWQSYHDKFGVLCWKHKDGSTWAGTARDLCKAFDIKS